MCIRDRLELVKGMNMKVKIVSQARMLMSSVEKRMGDRMFNEKSKKIREAVERLEEMPYKDAEKEMDKLREMITMLEVNHQKK